MANTLHNAGTLMVFNIVIIETYYQGYGERIGNAHVRIGHTLLNSLQGEGVLGVESSHVNAYSQISCFHVCTSSLTNDTTRLYQLW